MARKQTITEKVAKERRGAKDPAVRYGSDEERREEQNDATSELAVGNIFRFSPVEVGVIVLVCEEYEKKAKAICKGLDELDLATLTVDAARSECAIIRETVEHGGNQEITLKYGHRRRLGAMLSLHARKLDKQRDNLTDLLVDTGDVVEAALRVRSIADKIGEQLTLSLKAEEED